MPLSTPDVVVRHPDVGTRPAVRTAAPPVAAAVAMGSAALFGLAWGRPLMLQMMGDVDFPFHIEAARQFAADGVVTMPHFLLQVLLGSLLATGLFASPAQAGVVFFCAVYAATGGLICWYVARGGATVGELLVSVVLAGAIMLSAPILPRGEPSLFLIGYFPPNAYHNPTMLVAKPLLVLALSSAVAALARRGTPARAEAALLATPIVLLGLAKPNYLACLVPVLLVGAAWSTMKGRGVSWLRVGAVCAAAVGTLASTFLLYRSEELGFDTSVIVAPFRVIAVYAPVDPLTIVLSLSASLAFPLAVTAMWPRGAMQDLGMRIAWGGAAVALFVSYFLAEGGTRLDHGNFLWTGQMGVFVLFVAAAGFVRGRLQLGSPSVLMFGRALALGVILLFHVESGLRHAALKLEYVRSLAFWT